MNFPCCFPQRRNHVVFRNCNPPRERKYGSSYDVTRFPALHDASVADEGTCLRPVGMGVKIELRIAWSFIAWSSVCIDMYVFFMAHFALHASRWLPCIGKAFTTSRTVFLLVSFLVQKGLYINNNAVQCRLESGNRLTCPMEGAVESHAGTSLYFTSLHLKI